MTTTMARAEVPGVPGAEIREVAWLPDVLEGGTRVGPYSQARKGALLRIVPGVGRFLARDGAVIEVCREEGAASIAVDQFLYGAVRAALIYQRGGFPLHAACLVPPGRTKAVAIAGRSGAGKSTLAGELVRRGWSLLGDDLTAVYPEGDRMMAWPSRAGIRLWRDACEGFGIESVGLPRLPGPRDKYVVPAETRGEPAEMGAVLVLDRSAGGGVVPIVGPERLPVLMANTYRAGYLKSLQCMEEHFRLTCLMAERVRLGHLRCGGTVEVCAEVLEGEILAW